MDEPEEERDADACEGETEYGLWLRTIREGIACETNLDWAGSEAAYLRASTSQLKGLSFIGFQWLAQLFSLTGREEEFERAQQAAAAVATQGNLAYQCQSLEALSIVHKRRGEWAAALHLGERMLALLDGIPDDSLRHLVAPRLRTRLLVARCRFHLGDGDVQVELNEVWPLIEPYLKLQNATVWQNFAANWYDLQAGVREQEGDVLGGIAARRRVVEYCRLMALSSSNGVSKYAALAAALQRLIRALEPIDLVQAEAARQESDALRAAIRGSIGLNPLSEE